MNHYSDKQTDIIEDKSTHTTNPTSLGNESGPNSLIRDMEKDQRLMNTQKIKISLIKIKLQKSVVTFSKLSYLSLVVAIFSSPITILIHFNVTKIVSMIYRDYDSCLPTNIQFKNHF